MILRKSVVAWDHKVRKGTASCKRTAGNFGVIEMFCIMIWWVVKLYKIVKIHQTGNELREFYCM